MPATAKVRIGADTAQFKQAMGDVEKTMKRLESMTRSTTSKLTSMIKLGAKLSFGGGLMGATGVVASEKMFRGFEKQMMEVFTLLPKANKAMFGQMSKDALAFSEKFGVLPEEVSRGMYQAISAGIPYDDLMVDGGFLEVAQKSAIAGVTDLRTAVDALTNVVNSYGKEAYSMEKVADSMFHAVSMSKTTFRELADYMYQVIPTASSMKVELDDLMATISALAASGTLTRVGTTQLRQMLIELGRTGDKANEAFLQGTGGLPVQEFIKQGGKIIEIINILGNVAKARRTDLRNLFSSVEAGNAALTLFNSEAYQGMIDAQKTDQSGAMSGAFEKMQSTFAFRLERMKRTFMNTFIRMGEALKPVFDDIYEYFEGIAVEIQNFDWQKLSDNFKQVWAVIKGLVKSGEIWDYLYYYARKAFAKILMEFAILTNKMAIFFGKAMSGENTGLVSLFSALDKLAENFVNTILLGIMKIEPALRLALAPLTATLFATFDLLAEKAKRLVEMPGETFEAEMAVRKKRKEELEKGGKSARQQFDEMDAGYSDDVKFAKLANTDEYFNKLLSEFRFSAQAQSTEGMMGFVSDDMSVTDIINDWAERQKTAVFGRSGPQRDAFDPVQEYFGGFGDLEALESGSAVGTEQWNKFKAFLDGIIADPSLYEDRDSATSDDYHAMRSMKNIRDTMDNFEVAFAGALQDKLAKEGKGEIIDRDSLTYGESYDENYAEQLDKAAEHQAIMDREYLKAKTRLEEKRKQAFAELKQAAVQARLDMAAIDFGEHDDSHPAIVALRNEVDAYDKAIKALEDKYKIEIETPPLPDAGGDSFERDPDAGGDFPVGRKMGAVVADSKQRVGGGGGFFAGFDPILANTKALEENTSAIRSQIKEGVQLAIKARGGEERHMINTILDSVNNLHDDPAEDKMYQQIQALVWAYSSLKSMDWADENLQELVGSIQNLDDFRNKLNEYLSRDQMPTNRRQSQIPYDVIDVLKKLKAQQGSEFDMDNVDRSDIKAILDASQSLSMASEHLIKGVNRFENMSPFVESGEPLNYA